MLLGTVAVSHLLGSLFGHPSPCTVLRRGTPKRGVAATSRFVCCLVGRIIVVASGMIVVVAVLTKVVAIVVVVELIKV